MNYSVGITHRAEADFLREAKFIAEESGHQSRAVDWLTQAYELIDSLEQFPRRYPLAPENALVRYEVRKLNHGRHFILFTVDEEQKRVYVLGCRHGMRLPHEQDWAGV